VLEVFKLIYGLNLNLLVNEALNSLTELVE